MKRGSLYLLTVCLLAVMCAQAEPPACDGRRRVLPVNVLDKEGNQVWGLTAADFRAEFRGQPVLIKRAGVHVNTCRIVLLLDKSRSMTDNENKWQMVLENANDLVRHGGKHCEVALIVFSARIVARTGFEKQAMKVLELLNTMAEPTKEEAVRGAVRDAIVEAFDTLGPLRSGDVIYAITEGQDTDSKNDFSRVEELLLQSGVRFFYFVPVTGRRRSTDSRPGALPARGEPGSLTRTDISRTGTPPCGSCDR